MAKAEPARAMAPLLRPPVEGAAKDFFAPSVVEGEADDPVSVGMSALVPAAVPAADPAAPDGAAAVATAVSAGSERRLPALEQMPSLTDWNEAAEVEPWLLR